MYELPDMFVYEPVPFFTAYWIVGVPLKELYAAEKFTAEPRHVPMGDTVTSEILGVGSL